MSERRRLTSHQRTIYDMIERHSRTNTGAVSQNIGNRGACQHLVRKGWITEEEIHGPRGGITYRYRPTTA
jgi:hypothetical protein